MVEPIEPIEAGPLEQPKLYDPYNSKYCKEIDCQHRHGNKCEIPVCLYPKQIRWWTKYKEGGA